EQEEIDKQIQESQAGKITDYLMNSMTGLVSAMQNGAKGIRILLAGRLGGAEMSRTLDMRLGSIPRSTLQAHVDYALAHSFTTYGALGVKVWVYRGMYSAAETQPEYQSNAAGGRARARGRR
ncbi:MAG: hypothetical protein EBY29_09595, partial [Planctomycetes bacterium]|nr:hypothetical protein [Planctomycetota bacterium]